MEAEAPPPHRRIASGTAGTGKTYLIHCIRLLHGDRLCVAAPTGVAAFNIDGHTLHSVLCLSTKGTWKESVYTVCSSLSQECIISSLMKCQRLEDLWSN